MTGTAWSIVIAGCAATPNTGGTLSVAVAETPRPAVQIEVVRGEIVEHADGPTLVMTRLSGDRATYFYPASSIKLVAALCAIERMNELAVNTTFALDEDTPWRIHPLFPDESMEDADESHSAGTITLRHEVRKLFLVSDNRAFNRLYEFVGPERLNRFAHEIGMRETWIVHRLSEARSPEENRQLPRIDLMGPDGATVTVPERTDAPSPRVGPDRGLLVGRAVAGNGAVVRGPFAFGDKNATTLEDLQLGLAKIVTPEASMPGRGVRISASQRAWLLEAMWGYPGDSTDPVYERARYPDDWAKFLLPGLERVRPKDEWRISNKIGLAYGFVIENAFVEHLPTGRSAFLAAWVYANPNAVLNDGVYGYDAVSFPVMAALGEDLGRSLIEALGQSTVGTAGTAGDQPAAGD